MEQLTRALQQYFGYDTFRDGQQEIIEHVIAGKNGLVIMPTGGGKSMCYQLPAVVLDGLTVVVSPLIALMQDQVVALRANGVAAGALNSHSSAAEQRSIYDAINANELKLLYVSPEKALTQDLLNYLKQKPISLIAIDEAHCVSVWGNDFRPEYSKLHELVAAFPNTPTLALTATADAATRDDIVAKLNIPSAKLFLSSFERENIVVSSQPAMNRAKKIIEFIQNHPGDAGIVYCLSRKNTERIAEKLEAVGIKAGVYHAGLPASARQQVQEDFQKDDLQVVCATIAFGMGIDKSNIRWVIHHNLPKNIESYYQEIGRAGRDGLPAKAILFRSYGDIFMLKRFIIESQGNETFKRVQEAKLDRMWQYAQTENCRTNIVLNYFNEIRNEPCGHCDNCLNPPQRFDGTEIAQKALSGVLRTNQKVGIGLLIDILRGSNSQPVVQNGYHELKTYGAGRDIPKFDWQQYIIQLIDQGLLTMDYTQRNTLKATELAKEVLFNGQKVQLSEAKPFEEKQKKEPPKTHQFDETLMVELKKLRKQIATEENNPAFVIFSDASLKDMVEKRPLTKAQFLEVSGVGEHKMEKYGDRFVEHIQEFVTAQKITKAVKGKTYIQTLQLIKAGLPLEDIAKEREMAESTIFGHLAKLWELKELDDVSPFIDQQEIDQVISTWKKLGETEELKPIFEALDEKVHYGKIKLALLVGK